MNDLNGETVVSVMIAILVHRHLHLLIGVGEQSLALRGGLIVIETLIMRKSL